MVAPTLADYEYQFKDTGFKLNSGSTLPFVDITKVQGLDMADFEANVDDNDGLQGGLVRVRLSQPRTLVLDGMLYANASTIESTIDTLITNYLPDDINYPFYYKHPGVSQRYCLGKSVAFKADIDALRRLGQSPVQFQVICEDPRKYIDNSNQTMTAGTNYTPSNPGNVNTYPIITVTGAFSTITFTNNSQTKSLVLTDTRVAGDVTVVDFQNRNVTVNGNNKSSIVTGSWWDIPAGGGQTVKYTVTGGPPTSVVMATKQGWM